MSFPLSTDFGALRLSMVAHELRAPLNAVMASSELLIDQLEELDPDQLQNMVSVLHRGTRRMQELVENLLCAGSIRAGRFQVQRRGVEPLDLVAEVKPVVMPMLAKKQQELRLSSRGPVRHVSADSRWIGQVLINLVSNASKFTPSGGVIDLTLRRQAHRVRIAIADRGPGLPPGRPLRLFEPFYRAPSAADANTDGVGLGLAIVQAIIEAHGGRVGAGNRRGGGARFWFELPTEPPTLAPVRPAPTRVPLLHRAVEKRGPEQRLARGLNPSLAQARPPVDGNRYLLTDGTLTRLGDDHGAEPGAL